MSDDTGELVYANGIDATTGGYLLPPMAPAEIAELVRHEDGDADLLSAVTKATGASGEAGVGRILELRSSGIEIEPEPQSPPRAAEAAS